MTEPAPFVRLTGPVPPARAKAVVDPAPDRAAAREDVEQEHEHQQPASDALGGHRKGARRASEHAAGGVLGGGQDPLQEVTDLRLALRDPGVVGAQPRDHLVDAGADVVADPAEVAEQRIGEHPGEPGRAWLSRMSGVSSGGFKTISRWPALRCV
jgi:hypothetical protein